MRFFLKAGGLLLILALPVLIYIFLQTFGENKYGLPVYYETGVDTLVTGCQFDDEGQYTIPARFFPSATGNSANEITIAFFQPSGIDVSDPMIAKLARVMNVFEDGDVNVLLLSSATQNQFDQVMEKAVSYGNERSQWALFSEGERQLLDIIACDFVIPRAARPGGDPDQFPLLLIDKKRRIRGYYKGGEREEIDRLVVEITILLENTE